jgi:hypothetical protein
MRAAECSVLNLPYKNARVCPLVVEANQISERWFRLPRGNGYLLRLLTVSQLVVLKWALLCSRDSPTREAFYPLTPTPLLDSSSASRR